MTRGKTEMQSIWTNSSIPPSKYILFFLEWEIFQQESWDKLTQQPIAYFISTRGTDIDEKQSLNRHQGNWCGRHRWWQHFLIHLPTSHHIQHVIKCRENIILSWIKKEADKEPVSGSRTQLHVTKPRQSSLSCDKNFCGYTKLRSCLLTVVLFIRLK